MMLSKHTVFNARIMAMLVALGAASVVNAQTAFTYQGRLNDSSGSPATGPHDLRFTLYNDPVSGSGLGTQCVNDVAIGADGVFTVTLDYGAVFTGSTLYLQIEVRPDAAQALACGVASGFTALTPRQAVRSAPQATYANFAATASNASTLGGASPAFYTNASNLTTGSLPSGRLGGTYSGAIQFPNASNLFTGAFSGGGSGLTSLNATNLSSGTVADARLSSNIPKLNAANAFSAGNTFGAVGVGVAPAHPIDVNTPAQTAMNLVGSNIGGSWLSLRNTTGLDRTWNLIVAGSSNAEAAGSFFVRDAAAGVRMLIDPAGNLGLGTSAPTARVEVRAADPAMYLRNSNDTGGGFALNSFGALQLGLFNPSASAWNTIPANGRRSLFGVSSLGTVGSLTNTGNSPAFRNILDDGAGNASVAGSIEVDGTARINSQVAIGGSIGGESLRVYGPILQDQDTNGPGFMTLTSSRTNGPELHLINSQATGKIMRMRNIGSGATAAFVLDNFTDSRELLRLTRTGSATLPGGGLTANGAIQGTSFLMEEGGVSFAVRNFTPYLDLHTGATGNAFSMQVFQSGYGNDPSYAVRFVPDAQVSRSLIATTVVAGVKLFEIDHPLDPDNKTLRHACIESDQMVTLYRGNVTLGEDGRGTVTMPGWFAALNTDCSYVLTPVGAWAPVFIEAEMKDGVFVVAGGRPGMKVSWQVSAVRQDEFARNAPLEVEREKSPEQRGKRLYHYPATGAEMPAARSATP